jgi:alpha-tubulin suppressor-like RCC1 family protein
VSLRSSTAIAFLLLLAAGLLGAAPAAAGAATIVVPSGATQFSVSPDGNFGCAVVEGGAVECWGDNEAGEHGIGTTAYEPGRTRIAGLTGVESVSAAGEHVCALLAGGTIRCWGRDFDGELGNGTVANHIPSPVTVSGISTAVAIGTGTQVSCAVLADGTARCWGTTAWGSLGDGSNGPGSSPVPVVVSGLSGAVAIKPGFKQTCALLQTGAVDCWGSNGYEGVLGNGTETNSFTPVPVSAVGDATGLSSASVTCAPLFGGTVRCWGANTNGFLGNGTTERTLTPTTVSGLGSVREVSVGAAHSCALRADSSVWCWGQNYGGQLELEGALWSAAPVRMNIDGVFDVEAGQEYTCVLLGAGTVECWGNSYGHLAETSTVQPIGEEDGGGKAPGVGGGATVAPTVPPLVKIISHPPRETADQSAAFGFTGVAGGTYECSLDGGAWTTCADGASFDSLQPGDHRFEVREVRDGVTGPADSYSWTIDLPKACVLKVARARVFAFTHQSKARLVIRYKAYEPARVTVSYALAGTKGGLGLGSASALFKTAGVFRATEKLGGPDLARLRATTSMTVKFAIPEAPSSCTRYDTKRLTIPKKVFGQTVWFQSDSVFARKRSRSLRPPDVGELG